MGLTSSPGVFQHLKEIIFAGFSYEMALVYLDDVIVFGGNFYKQRKPLEVVFQRLAENGIKFKRSKFNFFPKACQFLRAHFFREWIRGRRRESLSSRKNEKTVLPERRQGFLRP